MISIGRLIRWPGAWRGSSRYRSRWILYCNFTIAAQELNAVSKFEEYRDKYAYIKMERTGGILQMTFHSKGKELLWGGRPHEEISYAFYDVARDRDNKAVIITGTGESFCADIIWGRA